MLVQWRSFTTSAKVKIMTDCTFIPITHNPRAVSFSGTVWAIAVDTVVLEMIRGRHWSRQEPINWSKAMSRVFFLRRGVTLGAVIPIRAVETLVPDPVNLLLLF